jgi:hypothetical protein
MFGASIHVRRAEGAPPFTLQEQDIAKAIAVEVGRAAGFRAIDRADTLSNYRYFVSLQAPVDSLEQKSVDVWGGMRDDHREIRILFGDYDRGQPLPSTQRMIDEMRVALERAFPDCAVEVTRHDKPRLFGP